MTLHLVKTENGKPLTDVMSGVVQIRQIDESNIATVVSGDGKRAEIKLAAGQQWIAQKLTA